MKSSRKRESEKAHEQHSVPTGVSAAKVTVGTTDQHVSTGVSAAKVTVENKRARNVDTEEGNMRRLRTRPEQSQPSPIDFTCEYCLRKFSSSAGASLHRTRWCRVRSGGAGSGPGRVPLPLAAHITESKKAQHHDLALWNYAWIHTDKKGAELPREIEMKPRVKFPHIADKGKWSKLDNRIFSAIITKISTEEFRLGDLDEISHLLCSTIYDEAANFCGVEKKSEVREAQGKEGHRSPALLFKLKVAKREARREYRKAVRTGCESGKAYQAFMVAVRLHNDMLRTRAKSKKESDRARECSRFLQDPNQYAKRLLAPAVKAKVAFSKEVADSYFNNTYRDSKRSYCYQPPLQVPRPAAPESPFPVDFVSFEEFSEICWKKSNGSAPGPNGIPYLLYKRCPQVRRLLWQICGRVWRERKVPLELRVGRVRLLAKSSDTSDPKLMRPISVLNVESRLFWTVFQRKLGSYMLSNKYIDSRIQKGFLEGVAGCLEHTTSHWEMFQDAKRHQRTIVAAWLDLENAYGSISHMLVQFALRWFHVPEEMAQLLFSYYDDIYLRVFAEDWSSAPFHLGIGVPQGCTASTIVFDVAFQVVLDIWRWLSRGFSPGYRFSGYDVAISCPTYADDVELVASSVRDCQESINCFQKALEWSRTLKAKPAKCRSLAFRLFRPEEKTDFKKILPTQYSCFDPRLRINEVAIKFIGEDDPPMFKYLGRYLQYDLREDVVQGQTESKLRYWLQLIDESPLDGRMKAWITNFHICSKLAWLLMVQKFSLKTVHGWQNLVHRMYRKWIGLAKSTEASVLYRSNEHFGLNLKNLVELRDRLQVVKWHIMKYSSDSNSRKVYDRRLALDKKCKKGRSRKAAACLLLEELERRRFLDDLSAGQHGREGLGSSVKSGKKGPRATLIQQMKKEAEEKRLLVLHEYKMQASWLSWGLDGMVKKDLSWNTLLYRYSQRLLKFLVNVQANTLPTPDNLRRWNLKSDDCCGLCGQQAATLTHILAGCPWVRGTENKLNREDRYTWRHNCVLLALAEAVMSRVEEERKRPRAESKTLLINFVKAGQKAKGFERVPAGFVTGVTDWECRFDLPEFRPAGASYVLPHDVVVTPLKADGYAVSRASKRCILFELTCPMEENLEKWHSTKAQKYAELRVDAEKNGWSLCVLVLEVGARGWIPKTTVAALRSFGLSVEACSKLRKQLSFLALKCSYVIWINRFNRDFSPWRMK